MELEDGKWGVPGQAVVIYEDKVVVVNLDTETLAGAKAGDPITGVIVGVKAAAI
jgi:hypothetical protein